MTTRTLRAARIAASRRRSPTAGIEIAADALRGTKTPL